MAEIIISNERCSAVINYHGAELKSFKKDGKEYMWNADPKYWGRTAPVLFPFVGAVNENKFRYNGEEFEMGQHGFARDMDFELVENDDTSCVFYLSADEDTLEKYPMWFELYIKYELKGTQLLIGWDVVNSADEMLEFSIGAHPAFNCVLSDSAIRIKYEGNPVGSFTNSVFGKGLLTGKLENIKLDDGVMMLDEHSFDGDAYVIEESQVDEVELLDKSLHKILSVKFTSPVVGIWSPPGKNAPFICIEPWYGRADREGFKGELKDRDWNNSLRPGEHFMVNYVIELA